MSYQNQLRLHILPKLGAIELGQVTRGHVKDLLAQKRSVGLSKNTVRIIRGTVSALFVDAIDSGIVTANPAAKIMKGRKSPDTLSSGEAREGIRAMTIERLAAFLEAAKGHRFETVYLLLADTGLRPGEALALRWQDVDLEQRQLRVSRAVERGGGIKGTKTGRSRTVDMTSRLTAALQQDLVRGADAELVFPGGHGDPLNDHALADAMWRILRRARLPRSNLYSLRHTFASHLLADGVPITYVSAQLGHAKPTMTLQAYAHFLPRGDRHYADRLEALRSAPQRLPNVFQFPAVRAANA